MPSTHGAERSPSGDATRPKFLFVTGGVTSSLGKGIVSASLGRLLRRAACA